MSSLEERRAKALEEYRKKLIEHRELDAKLKKSNVYVVCGFLSCQYCSKAIYVD